MDIRAGAGSGQAVTIDEGGKIAEWSVPQELLRSATSSPSERIKILSIVGDSMQPTFNPTEKVMVDTGDLMPSPPGIFIVWDGLGLVAKRVEFVAHSDPPTVRMLSDNQKYSTYERVIGEAHIQGRVIGKWLWT
jgi:phage repressor protein C with HTH and peptisase S24 domain